MPPVKSVAPQRWRSFVAARLPQRSKTLLQKQAQELRRQGAADKLRWLPEAQWHLTLRFLSDLPPELLWRLASTLQTQLADQPAFTLSLQAPNWFPNARRPSVLACRSDHPPELTTLLERLDAALTTTEIQIERRRFQGHISLARPRRGRLPELELPEGKEMKFEIGEIALFRSELRPEGAHHSVLARFPLS